MAVSVSGYGPVGASSASVPFFEGKREDFADFSYKLRAVLLELNIDDIVFNPTAFLLAKSGTTVVDVEIA